MENSETNNSARINLRQPFIDTANALASLYKQALAAERDSRDVGSRSAYQHIIQWAARKSRSNEQVSAADVISFCSSELVLLSNNQPPTERPLHVPQNNSPPNPTSQPSPDAEMAQSETTPVSYVARYDALASDIKKLHVNPRKRQRVEFSDTFIRACREENEFTFTSEHSPLLPPQESPSTNQIAQSKSQTTYQNTFPSKKDAKKDAKEARDLFFHHNSSNEYTSRKAKNSKSHVYDKHKRK